MSTTAQDYLAQKVNYGGEWITRAALYQLFADAGMSRVLADRWLQAYEITHKGETA